jgi:hypothetical protein
MRPATVIVGVLLALGVGTVTLGQSAQPRRIVGDRISESFQVLKGTGETLASETLTFRGSDGGPTFTVDFTTRFPGEGRPTSAPGAVDILVTEHLASDDSPAMSMRLNGVPLSLVARLHGRRSVAATVPFDEFVRLTNAEIIVQLAFGTELELSAMQRGMLRSVAQRWAGR